MTTKPMVPLSGRSNLFNLEIKVYSPRVVDIQRLLVFLNAFGKGLPEVRPQLTPSHQARHIQFPAQEKDVLVIRKVGKLSH